MDKQMVLADIRTERYEYNDELPLGGGKMHVRRALPRKEQEELALALATALLVFDEEKGIVYEGYNQDLLQLMYMLSRYTDLDIDPYDTQDGRYELYDILESNGALEPLWDLVREDFNKVMTLYAYIQQATKETFQMEKSLPQLLKKTLHSFLGGEDVTETIAKAQGLNNTLVELLSKVHDGAGGQLTRFAKKDIK